MNNRLLSMVFMSLLAFPASGNYELHSYSFGAGGTADSSSTNYNLNASLGKAGGNSLEGTNYDLGTGLTFARQADVPGQPTLNNPDNYHDKLNFVIDPGPNPADAQFLIAISDDNFITTSYVQSDQTVGPIAGDEDWQNFSLWGGVGGAVVIGLSPDTSYQIKVKAKHGDFTESHFSKEAVAATAASALAFDIDVAASDINTEPPFAINLNELEADVVATSVEKVWVDFATNATHGGRVYLAGSNAGLDSVSAGYTITSLSGNLSELTEGFGAQGNSVRQTDGGPFVVLSPFDGNGEIVGPTSTSLADIFAAANALVGGRGSFLIKAKASAVTPAASDYVETLTLVAAASF